MLVISSYAIMSIKIGYWIKRTNFSYKRVSTEEIIRLSFIGIVVKFTRLILLFLSSHLRIAAGLKTNYRTNDYLFERVFRAFRAIFNCQSNQAWNSERPLTIRPRIWLSRTNLRYPMGELDIKKYSLVLRDLTERLKRKGLRLSQKLLSAKRLSILLSLLTHCSTPIISQPGIPPKNSHPSSPSSILNMFSMLIRLSPTFYLHLQVSHTSPLQSAP